MLRSMTGYGSAILESRGEVIRVELRSLNTKGLDLSIRLPKNYSDKEMQLRTQLIPVLQRGKVSVFIEVEKTGNLAASGLLNRELLENLYRELIDVANKLGANTDNLYSSIITMDDVISSSNEMPNEEEWGLIEQVLNEALGKFNEFRVKEGASLAKELKDYINNIRARLQKINEIKDQRLEKIRTELRAKVAQVIEELKIDESRLYQELTYYAEKFDITEEIVRLDSHLSYFMDTLSEDASGKKLGFIAQEMGREINTIGAKANDSAIQKFIVEMKDELEKIKEQVLNIL